MEQQQQQQQLKSKEWAEDLLKRGYVEVTEFGEIEVGARVRGANQRYWQAVECGTGEVERIFHKPQSAWSQKYGTADVEMIVKRDDGTYSQLANYHVRVVKTYQKEES